MATQAQKAALKKARAAKKRKTSFFGLDGLGVPKTTEILDTFKKAGLILVGFVGGREVSRMVVKNDAEGFKKYLGSILQLGGGIVLSTMKNEPLKYIGYGLAASGAIEGASKLMKKDILADGFKGLSLGSILSNAIDVTKIKLPFEYMPELPPIDGAGLDGDEHQKIEDISYEEIQNEIL